MEESKLNEGVQGCRDGDVGLSVGQSTTLVQTEIPRQLSYGWP